MANAVRQPFAAWRNELRTWTMRFVGLDLTGSVLRLQVRLRADTPGSPLIDLATVTSSSAEGLKLAGVATEDGVPVSTVTGRINKTTMSDAAKVPYSGEIGADAELAYALQLDGTTRLFGPFVALANVMDSDDAPTSRPSGFGGAGPSPSVWSSAEVRMVTDEVTVSIDDAGLVAALTERAETAAAGAEAASEMIAPVALPPNEDGIVFLVAQKTGADTYLLVKGEYVNGDPYPPLPASGEETIYLDDPRLTIDGFIDRVPTSTPGLSFQAKRPFVADGGPGSTQQHEGSTARLAFYSPATEITIPVTFKGTTEGVVADTQSPTPFKAVGLVGGVAAGSVTSSGTGTGDDAKELVLTGLPAGDKLIEVYPSYGRSVEFGPPRQRGASGIGKAPSPLQALAVGGDSRFFGRDVSSPEKSVPIAVARALGLEPIGLAVAGRQLSAGDLALLAGVRRMRLSLMMGDYNPYQLGQWTPAEAAAILASELGAWFTLAPAGTDLIILSSVWAAADASGTLNAKGKALNDYRVATEGTVAAHASTYPSHAARLHLIQGLPAMGHNPNRLSDGTHFLDLGAGETVAAILAVATPVLGA